MPTTRLQELLQGSSATGEENDTLSADPVSLKSSSTTAKFNAPLSLPKRNLTRTNSSSSQMLASPTRRSFKRTVSLPADHADISGASDATGGIASRTRTKASSGTTTSRKSSTSSRTGAAGRSQRSSIAGSSHCGDEPSDNEEDRAQRSQRIGGCSQGSEAQETRDDTNKENVAPFRHAVDMTDQQRMTQARDEQEEAVARRTRTAGPASPMERRVSAPAHNTRQTRATATPSSTPARRSPRGGNDDDSSSPTAMQTPSPSRRTSQRAGVAALDAVVVVTPFSRKRARAARDDADADEDVRSNPAASLARLRLDDGASHGDASLSSPSVSTFGADDAESYFSSQCTTTSSIFTTNGQSQEASRCSTPASSRPATPLDHVKRSRIAAVEDQDDELAALDDVDAATDAALPDDTIVEYEAAEPTFANVYSHARSLLRCNAGTDGTDEGPNAASEVHIVGREKERKTLQRFLHSRFDLFQHMEHSAFPTGERSLLSDLDGAQDSGALYVCGMPGTGKTALLRSILAELREAHLALPAPRIAFVNCMTVDHPRAIFAKVLEALGEEELVSSVGTASPAAAQADAEAERKLDAIVRDTSRRTLIVLDEIDHLLRSHAHQNIMYKLFSWAASSAPGKDGRGTCALVGIANSLDLTERFVPLLATKGAAPALLHFRPFEAAEIVSVVRARLTGLHEHYDGTPSNEGMDVDGEAEPRLALFMPAALDLAAKKIAVATGDLRKALDAARLAVDLVETEQRKKALTAAAATQDEGDAASLLAHFTPATAPKVTPQHILKVLNTVLGSPQLAKVRNLGLQPKLVLLGLLVAQRRAHEQLAVLGSATAGGDKVRSVLGADGAVRLADVEMTYAAALKHDGSVFTALEASELLDVFNVLSVSGIIAISDEASARPCNMPLEGAASSSVSHGAKRTAKKQLLPANRMVRLVLSTDEALKGITTPPPASAAAANANGTAAAAVSASTLEAIRRIWNAEEERVRRSRTWQAQARESQAVRREELGGGRGAVGAF